MANWKRVHSFSDILGELVLLREDFAYGSHTSYYAGTVQTNGDDGYCVQTHESKIGPLYEDETYHYVLINEILF